LILTRQQSSNFGNDHFGDERQIEFAGRAKGDPVQVV
jgi:hypothetical protein